MHFVKYHGLGNEFLITVVEELPRDPSQLAIALCNSENNIGADGLIFGIPHEDETIDRQMILFNADGGRAEISGNGVRCLAHELFSDSGFEGSLQILTDAGIRETKFVEKNSDSVMIEVNMGYVEFGPEIVFSELGVQTNLEIVQVGTVDVGNPHIVLQVKDIHAFEIAHFGPLIESAWSEDGVNVHIVQVNDRAKISMLTWERGAGVTAACGSGAIASATIAMRWDLVDSEVTVSMAGGAAGISKRETGVFLKGESVKMSDHEVPTSG